MHLKSTKKEFEEYINTIKSTYLLTYSEAENVFQVHQQRHCSAGWGRPSTGLGRSCSHGELGLGRHDGQRWPNYKESGGRIFDQLLINDRVKPAKTFSTSTLCLTAEVHLLSQTLPEDNIPYVCNSSKSSWSGGTFWHFNEILYLDDWQYLVLWFVRAIWSLRPVEAFDWSAPQVFLIFTGGAVRWRYYLWLHMLFVYRIIQYNQL